MPAGRACNGEFRKPTSRNGASYCTHPKAKSYTCEYLCSHGLCPCEGEVVPKSEPKAPKAAKAKKGGK